MTDKEREWLQQLHDKLSRHADVFSDPRYSGFWESVIDKYSDQAHFVYELLQNADDAGATWVRFELHKHELVFRHNGKKLFTVSNPETEVEDQQNGKLGHVNAIAAIGMSQKLVAYKEGNQIGKFGVGFKSVFRYTNNPRIYDDNICFKIERRIVPSVVDSDYFDRQSGETVFVFPFDNGDVDKSYCEVANKVQTLQCPLLFLRNLMEIRYCTEEKEGIYSKECSEWRTFEFHADTVDVDIVRTSSVILRHCEERLDIQVFIRCLDGGEEVAVGYEIKDGRPVARSGTGAFCFFQTDVPTGLNFIIHAPFLLTDNRQGIKDDSTRDANGMMHQGHNERMIDGLATLAADAIWVFTKLNNKRVTEDIINVIPARIKVCASLPDDNLFRRNFDLIRQKFIHVFQSLQVVPINGGYALAKDCMWPFDEGLNKLLSGPQIEELLRCNKNKWGFAEYPGIRNGLTKASSGRFKYIFSNGSLGEFLFRIFGDPKSLSDIVCVLTPGFVQNQTEDWRRLLYEQIAAAHYARAFLADKNILLNQTGHVVPAYDQGGHEQLWLPTEGVTNVHMVNEVLMRDPNVETLAHVLELRKVEKPSRKKQILKLIEDAFVATIGFNEYMQVFKQVFDFYREELQSQQEVITAMKGVPSLYVQRCADSENEYLIPSKLYPNSAKHLYISSGDFRTYLAGLAGAYIIDVEPYVGICGDSYRKELLVFLKALGVQETLIRLKDPEPLINYCKTNFNRHISIKNHDKLVANCKATWNLLVDFIRVHCKENRPFLNYMKYKPNNKDSVEDSSTLSMMQEIRWIIDSNGNLRKPTELHIEDLDAFYNFDTWPARQLADAICLKRMTSESLSDTDRASMELGRRFKAIGIEDITVEDLEKIKRILMGQEDRNAATTGIVPRTTTPTDNIANMGTADISLSDGQYAGLSRDEQILVNKEAIEIVKEELSHKGFDFSKCTEKPCRIDGAVDSEGQERPLVVHSAKKDASAIFLSAADVEQLRKPNALLIVVTKGNVLIQKTLQDLVGRRERLVLSFSVSNLDAQERINCFANSLRYFKGLRFKFDILSNDNGIARFLDSPENPIPEDQEELQKSPDSESGVL